MHLSLYVFFYFVFIFTKLVVTKKTHEDYISYAAWSNLDGPQGVRFTMNNGVFIFEKKGTIYYSSEYMQKKLNVVADLSEEVLDCPYSRGLTDQNQPIYPSRADLAVDPEWPDRNYIYVYYVRDGNMDDLVPRYNDWCASSAMNVVGVIARLTYNATLEALDDFQYLLTLTSDPGHLAQRLGYLRFSPSSRALLFSILDKNVYAESLTSTDTRMKNEGVLLHLSATTLDQLGSNSDPAHATDEPSFALSTLECFQKKCPPALRIQTRLGMQATVHVEVVSRDMIALLHFYLRHRASMQPRASKHVDAVHIQPYHTYLIMGIGVSMPLRSVMVLTRRSYPSRVEQVWCLENHELKMAMHPKWNDGMPVTWEWHRMFHDTNEETELVDLTFGPKGEWVITDHRRSTILVIEKKAKYVPWVLFSDVFQLGHIPLQQKIIFQSCTKSTFQEPDTPYLYEWDLSDILVTKPVMATKECQEKAVYLQKTPAKVTLKMTRKTDKVSTGKKGSHKISLQASICPGRHLKGSLKLHQLSQPDSFGNERWKSRMDIQNEEGLEERPNPYWKFQVHKRTWTDRLPETPRPELEMASDVHIHAWESVGMWLGMQEVVFEIDPFALYVYQITFTLIDPVCENLNTKYVTYYQPKLPFQYPRNVVTYVYYYVNQHLYYRPLHFSSFWTWKEWIPYQCKNRDDHYYSYRFQQALEGQDLSLKAFETFVSPLLVADDLNAEYIQTYFYPPEKHHPGRRVYVEPEGHLSITSTKEEMCFVRWKRPIPRFDDSARRISFRRRKSNEQRADEEDEIRYYLVVYRAWMYGEPSSQRYHLALLPSELNHFFYPARAGSQCDAVVLAMPCEIHVVSMYLHRPSTLVSLVKTHPPPPLTPSSPSLVGTEEAATTNVLRESVSPCQPQTLLLDNWEHPMYPDNYLHHSQWHCGHSTWTVHALKSHGVASNQMLLYRPFRSYSTWWSMLKTVDDTWPSVEREYTHLTFLMMGPPASDFSLTLLSSKTPLSSLTPMHVVSITPYLHEQIMTGEIQRVWIPLTAFQIPSSMQITGVKFMGFKHPELTYFFDDLAFVRSCGDGATHPLVKDRGSTASSVPKHVLLSNLAKKHTLYHTVLLELKMPSVRLTVPFIG